MKSGERKTGERIRVLLAKAGLDGHDRGIKVIVKALRDAGMEVVYLGLYQTPEMIVQAAVQEDVDVIGVSLLSGAHLTLFPRILSLLNEQGVGHIAVIGGGIVPEDDVAVLEAAGVKKVFLPGTALDEIVRSVQGLCRGAHEG